MSSIMSRVKDIIEELQRRKRSISCSGSDGLLLLMEELGFCHRAGKTEGHRIFVHKGLSDCSHFTTHSIDCGHKPKRAMNFRYVTNTVSKLKEFESELEAIYEKNHP